jgi:nitrate reductase NapE component
MLVSERRYYWTKVGEFLMGCLAVILAIASIGAGLAIAMWMIQKVTGPL